MEKRDIRTAMLIGEAALLKLKEAHIAVFGVGGVGGYAVEALVRAGVGAIDLIDNDTVSESNINRQIIATYDTVGMKKTDAAEKRILSINPSCRVRKFDMFFTPENKDELPFSEYSYVVDAIDFRAGKVALAEICEKLGIPIISAMGAGNKLDPAAFSVTDIYKTSVCPLARAMRTELKKRGVKALKVVYSTEPAKEPFDIDCRESKESTEAPEASRRAPASISFVPSAAGLIIASEVIRDICGY